MNAAHTVTVVGLQPWLPWPLSGWTWWTRPVRAERLAALRIGLAGFLLVDILTSYGPHLADFFGTGGLGGAQLFAYYGAAPKLNWSILRGLGDPLVSALALGSWFVLTAWLVVDFWAARSAKVARASIGWSILWLALGIAVGLGVWSRGQSDTYVGLGSWQDEPALLAGAFWTWVAATIFLLLGFWTRAAAIVTWRLRCRSPMSTQTSTTPATPFAASSCFT